jgi:prepilin-type N-terminal cleavage/methylation domain-containing protein
MKRGFTLAEVLITLGIIGVVAALTIPHLIQKYNEYVTVRKVKEAYSILSQAYARVIDEYGGSFNHDYKNWNCINYTGCILSTLGKYMNVIDYKTNPNDREKLTFLSLKKEQLPANKYASITLSNGFKILVYAHALFDGVMDNLTGWDIPELEKTRFNIFVDINGDSPPNALGHDIFVFKLHERTVAGYGNRTEPYYYFSRVCNLSSASTWDGGQNGQACTGWVLEKENMEYLHCNDLNFNGKSKCH